MSFRFRLGIGLLLILMFAFVFVVEKSMSVNPGPETQSAFLKTYDPAAAIGRYAAGAKPDTTRTIESSGSWGFSTHKLEIKPELTMEGGQEPALLAALEKDANDQLARAGGHLVSRTDEKPAGFRLGYEIGRTRGAIAVKAHPGVHQIMALDITIQEMFASGTGGPPKK